MMHQGTTQDRRMVKPWGGFSVKGGSAAMEIHGKLLSRFRVDLL